MDHLHHDPRTKKQIKDLLYAHLYDPVHRQFEKRLETIIIQNTVLTGSNHKSFAYKGEIYNIDPGKPPRKANRLAKQLEPAMELFLQEKQELNQKEVPYVVGYLNQVLNASNDFHDWLRLLPDSMHGPLRQIIASCPCRTQHLDEAAVIELREKNQQAIALLKQRMVINLIT